MNKTGELLKVESMNEFVPVVGRLCGSGSFGVVWIFRGQGQRRETWPLLPKAGRAGFFDPNNAAEQEWEFLERYGYLKPLDMAVFSEWKRRGAICVSDMPSDEWECLALAQHHGLATRLLDWTRNPLVALFFAAWEEPQHHGAVYAIPSAGVVTTEKFSEVKEVMTFEPRPFHRRIEAQQGLFTYHPNPCKRIEPSAAFWTINKKHSEFGTNVIEINIPSSSKGPILEDLAAFGITRSSLFPDLDGLAMELNYAKRRYVTRRVTGWPTSEPGLPDILPESMNQPAARSVAKLD